MSEPYPEIEPFARGMLDAGDGHRVYWECCGNPLGKPALVLHGGPGSAAGASWRRFFDPAAYRVVLFVGGVVIDALDRFGASYRAADGGQALPCAEPA